MIMLRSRLREIFSTGQDLLIYENKGVLPRFFLAPKAKGFPNSEALLDAIATANPENFQREVLAEEKYLENIEKLGFQQSTIKINRYSPDIIQLDVQLDGNGILIASNSYSPFWKAFVDGEEKEIFPAYHAFWGIYLTKGHHQVSLDYKPPYKLF